MTRPHHLTPDLSAVALEATEVFGRDRELVAGNPARLERLRSDPGFYDPLVAAWWLWGIDLWIGSGWCRDLEARAPRPKMPRSDPRRSAKRSVAAHLTALQKRLRGVRVLCGDWERAVGPSSLTATLRKQGGGRIGHTAVLLDPPYETSSELYSGSVTKVCRDVWRWAEEHGNDPHLRIVVCGYDGEWSPPEGWATIAWTKRRAYASHAGNGERERLWCSPACLPVDRPQQAGLFAAGWERR